MGSRITERGGGYGGEARGTPPSGGVVNAAGAGAGQVG